LSVTEARFFTKISERLVRRSDHFFKYDIRSRLKDCSRPF